MNEIKISYGIADYMYSTELLVGDSLISNLPQRGWKLIRQVNVIAIHPTGTTMALAEREYNFRIVICNTIIDECVILKARKYADKDYYILVNNSNLLFKKIQEKMKDEMPIDL